MKNIDLVFGIDDNYSKYCTIAIQSILSHLNSNYKLNIAIIYEKLSIKSLNNFKTIKSKQLNKITFHKIYLKKFMKSNYWHKSIFYRFYIDRILPSNIKKIIYIDSDIFVNDSIHKLYNIDLKNYNIGAVIDAGTFNINYLDKLEMKSNVYFNSGVLLINIKKWKSDKITTKLEKTIKKYGANLQNPDQDLLNIIFEKKFKIINPKWNLQTIMYSNYKYLKYLKNKGVHHFTFVKPWRSYSSHPKSKVYREFAKQKGFIIETNYLDVKDFLSMLKYYIRYFLIFNIYKLINL
jgi:UDP-glucose/galactose:(glucosyl)LPS alpha-1,2-glucosyl/galactosyltransferase